MVCPVMADAKSEQRNAARLAMSAGSTIRPMGISATAAASSASVVVPLRAARSAVSPIYRSVRVLPG